MLVIYYLCKKYETTGSIKNKRERDKKPKISTREDYECKICAEKERYIVKRDFERLEIEFVNSNSLPYNQKLRADKLYPKKKTIHLRTKYDMALGLCKRAHFEGFTILGQCFMVIQKQI
ncbi:hypothetical protein AVEN_150886-1 [Araneus ventricosus]|uniref:Uncharacterized protein n=1 Tax=Araneus ventricosus TaxID=182803 RepID=A0A4Y2C8N9_ARAVE|nr:hypothetical protein AVEN_150886-1 [Araneus ventricosus]